MGWFGYSVTEYLMLHIGWAFTLQVHIFADIWNFHVHWAARIFQQFATLTSIKYNA